MQPQRAEVRQPPQREANKDSELLCMHINKGHDQNINTKDKIDLNKQTPQRPCKEAPSPCIK